MSQFLSVMQLSRQEASTLSQEQVLQKLSSNLTSGLTSLEATRRLGEYGENKMHQQNQESLLSKFIDQFKEPMILLLLSSAIISILLGQWDDAISITLAVVIVVFVAFVQEYRSENSLQALNNLVPQLTNCIRDGIVRIINAEQLVPGDIINISVGDKVPADCRIISSTDLVVDESSLTGENLGNEKNSDRITFNTIGSQSRSLIEFKNILFMGTLICNGHARAIVIDTGANTEFGRTFAEMESLPSRKTPLQRKMADLGKQLSAISFCVIGTIAVVGFIQGRSLLEEFKIGVSLAVAAIPEGLPICVTVTLALGVLRMSKRNAIVKQLTAVESLGCTTVICVDKTGTLTQNQMTVREIFLPGEHSIALVTGIGHHTSGEVFLNGNHIDFISDNRLKQLLQTACLCNNASIIPPQNSSLSECQVIGTPTETSLLILAKKLGMGHTWCDPRDSSQRLHEFAFNSDRKLMEVQCKINNQTQFYVKGMVEKILVNCVNQVTNSVKQVTASESQFDLSYDTVMPMSDADRALAMLSSLQMAERGLRVLALAYGTDSNALTFAGLVGIEDPPREGVEESINTIQETGVRVCMITGDARETAISVASRLGFFQIGEHVAISGYELEQMSNEEIDKVIKNVSVFYRSSPRHKLSIIQAFQRSGEIVAMTGDGVNDGPALKAADIGVAMGKYGTDVAKEAAHIIITDDNFSTIVDAIQEGKSIFHNIKNFLSFQLSTSVAALMLVAITTLFGFNSPLNAMQILWINIIMDGPPAQSLGVEPVHSSISMKPPRKPTDPILSKKLLTRVILTGIWIVIGTLYIYFRALGAEIEHSRKPETMAFTTFVMFDMFNAFSCRNLETPVTSISFKTNRPFLYATGGSIFAQLLVLYVPFFQEIFQTTALNFQELFLIIFVSFSVLIFDTFFKRFRQITVNGIGLTEKGHHKKTDGEQKYSDINEINGIDFQLESQNSSINTGNNSKRENKRYEKSNQYLSFTA